MTKWTAWTLELGYTWTMIHPSYSVDPVNSFVSTPLGLCNARSVKILNGLSACSVYAEL